MGRDGPGPVFVGDNQPWRLALFGRKNKDKGKQQVPKGKKDGGKKPPHRGGKAK